MTDKPRKPINPHAAASPVVSADTQPQPGAGEGQERWQRLVNAIAGAFNNGLVPGSDAEAVEWAIEEVHQQAARIAEQDNEIARLREALEGESPFYSVISRLESLIAYYVTDCGPDYPDIARIRGQIAAIHAALKGKSDG